MTFFQWNLLYTIYSVPNFILPLVGGIIIDKFLGKRIGIIMFATIISIGIFFFALSTNVVKSN